jgi:hypothetical protein
LFLGDTTVAFGGGEMASLIFLANWCDKVGCINLDDGDTILPFSHLTESSGDVVKSSCDMLRLLMIGFDGCSLGDKAVSLGAVPKVPPPPPLGGDLNYCSD